MRKRLGWRFNQRHSIPDWIEHRYDGLRYARRVLVTRPQNLIGYWPMWEGNGVVSFDNSPQGNDGAYTGVTLAQPGIGDGRYSAFFDGANDFNNIWSAGLVADFNGTEGALLIWARVANAGVWTDGAVRYLLDLLADANNYIYIRKQAVANNFLVTYAANAILKQRFVAINTTEWMCWALTWSVIADEVRVYLDGIQQGATFNGLGVWVGNLVNMATIIGAANTGPNNVWHGNGAHCALYNAALTPAEMAFVGTPL